MAVAESGAASAPCRTASGTQATGRPRGRRGRSRVASFSVVSAALDPVLAGRSKARWKAIHKSMRVRMRTDPKFEK